MNERVRVTLPSLIELRHSAQSISLSALNIRASAADARVSPFRGRGMEFEESRRYQPGDDVRSLDWRVTARTGKPHTKLFREERERPVLFWVDLRPPMFFATTGCFKSVQAARAVALLAWAAAGHGDRVGSLLFSNSEHLECRPARGRNAVLRLLRQLCQHPAWDLPGGGTNAVEPAAPALLRLRRVARPGSLVFLITDGRNRGDKFDAHLANVARHNSVVLILIHDRLEVELPPADTYRVSDGKRELSVNSAGGRQREAYHNAWVARREQLKTLATNNRVHVIEVSTGDDIVLAIGRGLRLRA
ncbi:MAG: DUF58 domain-containing protein [Pseudomonadota bacterium]